MESIELALLCINDGSFFYEEDPYKAALYNLLDNPPCQEWNTIMDVGLAKSAFYFHSKLPAYIIYILQKKVFGNSLNDGVTYEWVENLSLVAGRYIHATQKIQLNKYIVNTAEKLLMVLSHECCHAVAFNLHGREGNPPGGHGFAFFYACHRFAQTLPHLPPITVYHNYLVPKICLITCKCGLSKHYSQLYQPLSCRRCGQRFTEEDKVYRKAV